MSLQGGLFKHIIWSLNFRLFIWKAKNKDNSIILSCWLLWGLQYLKSLWRQWNSGKAELVRCYLPYPVPTPVHRFAPFWSLKQMPTILGSSEVFQIWSHDPRLRTSPPNLLQVSRISIHIRWLYSWFHSTVMMKVHFSKPMLHDSVQVIWPICPSFNNRLSWWLSESM